MKTSKLIYRFEDLLSKKQIPYYLRHFIALSAEVLARYPNLFRKAELDRYTIFFSQSSDAISLYLRLANRRGQWFKISSLAYPELDTPRAIDELAESGFASRSMPEKNDIDILYPVLTKNEIAALLGSTSNRRKEVLWEQFILNFDKIKKQLPAMICIRDDHFFRKLMTIYFGNPYQDMSTFVVEELQHLIHFPVELSPQKLWRTYRQFADYDAFIEWEKEMGILYDNGDMAVYRRQTLNKMKEFIKENKTGSIKSIHLTRTSAYRMMKFLIRYAAIENRYFPDNYTIFLKMLKTFSWKDDLAQPYYNLQIIDAKKKKNINKVKTLLDEFREKAKPYSVHDEVLLDKTQCWLDGKRRTFPSIPVVKVEMEMVHHDGQHPFYKTGESRARVEEAVIHHLWQKDWLAFHTENFIPRFAGVLLFIDEIFLPIPGQFQSHFQNGPLDFHSKSFYRRRKKYLKDKMRHYHDHPSAIQKTLWENYRKYQNYALPGIYLKNLEDEQIYKMIYDIPAAVWQVIAMRFIYHPGANGTGFPDISAINLRNGEYKFIEVKSPGDKISDSQTYWMKYLKENEVNCEVLQVVNQKSK